jgi:hypothetical protein
MQLINLKTIKTMGKYIYYVVADFVGTDEFFDAPIDMNEELLEQWCKEGKAEKYTIEEFVKAFNDQRISDLGMLYYM